MTVHTHIQRGNRGMPADQRIAVTIQTADLVDAGMYFMRVEDGLFRLIALLTAQADRTFCEIVTACNEEHQDRQGYIDFITVERHRLTGRDPFFIVRKLLQTAVDLQQDEHDHGEDQGQDTVEQRIVALLVLGPGSAGVNYRARRNSRFHILEDGVDFRIAQVGEGVHRRLLELVEQRREIGIARRQHLLVVVDPRMQ